MSADKIDLDPIESTILSIIGKKRKILEQITFELNQARVAIELDPLSREEVRKKLQGLVSKGLLKEIKIQDATYWETTKLADEYT